DLGADDFGQRSADEHRRADDRSVDAPGGGADVVDRRGCKHRRGGVAVHLSADNAKRCDMRKSLIALAAALLASPAWSDTLFSNVNGVQASADGGIEHFGSLLIGDNGRVKQVYAKPNVRLGKFDHMVDGKGR